MSNGVILTGNADEVKVFEGFHDHGDGKWGNFVANKQWPTKAPVKNSLVQRMYNELMDYLDKEGRTIQEEYNLVSEKKSNLSRRLREFLWFVVEFEKGKEIESQEEKQYKIAAD